MGTAFLIAFALVMLAELGDKSQLLLVGFATRYRPVPVLVGAAIAIAVLQLIAVALGRVVGSLIPTRPVAVVAGVVFIVFGVLAWRDGAEEAADAKPRQPSRLGPVLTVAAAFFVAEFGDKTQLMTMSIAADPAAALRTLGALAPAVAPPAAGSATAAVGVWLGSSLGMLAADALAVGIGVALGRRLPAQTLARVSAVAFVGFGIVTLASAFVGS